MVPTTFGGANVTPQTALMPANNTMTFEAWIKPDASGVNAEVLGMMGGGGFAFWLACDTPNVPGCCVDAPDNALAFHVGDDGSSSLSASGWSPSCDAVSEVGVKRNTWSHVAVRTFQNGADLSVEFFVDGVPAGTNFVTNGVLSAGVTSNDNGMAGKMMLGRTDHCDTLNEPWVSDPSFGCFKYNGFMDGVRMWNAAVVGETISSKKAEKPNPYHPNLRDLIFELAFDDAPAGDVALDTSVNGRHASVFMCAGSCDPTATLSAFENVLFDNSTFSKKNRAMVFDGVARYEIENVDGTPGTLAPFTFPQLTVDAWVYPSGTATGVEMLVSHGAGFEGWGLLLMCTSGGQASCCATGGHAVGTLGFFAGNASCGDWASSTAVMPRNTWSHVAVTATPGGGALGDETLVAFYVDGVFSGSKTTTLNITKGGSTLGLGGIGGGCVNANCYEFHGQMDTVRIANTTLAPGFVSVAMDGPTHVTFPFANSVLAEFTFDNGPIASVGDLAVVGVPLTSFTDVFSSEDALPFGDPEPFSGNASLLLTPGLNGWVRTAGGASVGLNPPAFTFEAWISPSVNSTGTSTIAMLGDFGWGLVVTCYGPGSGCCDMNTTEWDVNHATQNVLAFATDTTCDLFPRSTTAVAIETWTHVAVSVDSERQHVFFYVDGVAAGGGTGEHAVAGDGGGGPLVLGTNLECANVTALSINSSACAAFSGNIDNVRMWRKPLVAWEVLWYKNRHVHALDPAVHSLVANYSFKATLVDTHLLAHSLISEFDFAVAFPFDLHNAVPLADAKFVVPNPAALRFTKNTTVRVPLVDVTAFAPTSLTFEVWIKPEIDATSKFGGFLASLGDAGWRVGLMCNAGAGDSANDSFVGCCVGGTHVENSVGFYANDDDPCTQTPSSTKAVTNGEWTHVAVVVTEPGGVVKNAPRGAAYSVCFLINGEDSGCFSSPSYGVASGLQIAFADIEALRLNDTAGVLAGDFALGGFVAAGNASACGDANLACASTSFRGLMDNVRVWNAPLSHAVVGNYAASEIDNDHPYLRNLVANYSFAEGKFQGEIDLGAISDTHKLGDRTGFDGTVLNGTYELDQDLVLSQHPRIVPTPSGTSSFFFNGFDQYITTPFSPVLAPSDVLTVEVWVKPMGPDFVMQPIVGLGDLGWGLSLMCGGTGLFGNETDWRGCCGDHVDGSVGFLSSLEQLAGEACAAVPSSTTGVTYGRWNHVAVTVDVTKRTAEFFVDGVLAGSVSSWDVTLTNGGGEALITGGCPGSDPDGCQVRIGPFPNPDTLFYLSACDFLSIHRPIHD